MANKKAHFIGICGKGMSAVAKLLQDKGFEISGSDDGFYPPVSDYIKRHNFKFRVEYKAENIPEGVDLVVIGKNAKLVPETNEEVRAAFDKKLPIKSFPEVLWELTKDTENIVVAGSYGKSTATALLAWCLKESGKEPSYFIGEVVRGMDDHAHLGSGKLFVLEGDEYPSSNWDNTSKFLYYNPTHVLLSAASHDHVNVFPTQDDFEAPFKKLISLMPEAGTLIACADEKYARRIAEEAGRDAVFYGLDSDSAKWSARNVKFGDTTTFILTKGSEDVVEIQTSLLGRHNIQNIVGASAMLLERKLLTSEELRETVKTFKGVKRRMELLTQNSSIPVYEGFGSSRDKALAAIGAIKLHFPGRRIVVLFEPHTFSWRSRDMLHWYDDVFAGCGLVLVYHPAAQGASTHNQATQEEIVERVRRSGVDARTIKTKEEIIEILSKELAPEDVVLILTSGSFDGMIDLISKFVENRFSI